MGARGHAVFISAMMLICLVALPVSSSTSARSVNEEPVCNAERNVTWTVGLVFCENSISPGYTLVSPMPSSTSYLIDNDGREVHSWTSPGGYRPGLSAYILPDGDLLRTANLAQEAVGDFSGGGIAGKIERISWNGELEWSWDYSSTSFISHHDIEPMPNGNILVIAWEDKTEAEALQAGRNPEIASDAPGGTANVWPDHIIEVQPVGTSDANIVWQWNAWDHLIQDYDPTKDNYGVVAEHPELLDINYIGATGNQAGRADWMHCNGIDYNVELDQIVLSCKNMNEIYILDHSTTTQEAASHSGGNSGKGGDLLYRWGNPQTHDAGLSSDQQLFSQHDVQWIEEGLLDEGKLILFNNGVGRNGAYSSIEVIDTPLTNGTYELQANNTWGPNTPSWSWNRGEAMYAAAISGVQRLENGNTLVTYGTRGTLYEVSPSGMIVWTYINPITGQGSLTQGDEIPDGNRAGTTANQVFKSHRYPVDFEGFSDKDMTPTVYLELWTDQCPNEESLPWDNDGDGCIDDSDMDGVTDPNDQCIGFDDTLDVDQDTIPDECDDSIDSDGDGIQDFEDKCEGFNDTVDVDYDAIPDGCDSLIDTDGDGVADVEDMCEGEDDEIDDDDDGIPNGCDETPFPASNEVNEPSNESFDEGNQNQPPASTQDNDSGEDSNLTTDEPDISEAKVPSSSVQSAQGETFMKSQLILAFALIFAGLWLIFYVLATQLKGTTVQTNAANTLLPVHEARYEYADSFPEVKPMIDLPHTSEVDSTAAPTIAAAEYERVHSVQSPPPVQPRSGPQVPLDGLPHGWTMEQWQFYGQQWLDARRGN